MQDIIASIAAQQVAEISSRWPSVCWARPVHFRLRWMSRTSASIATRRHSHGSANTYIGLHWGHHAVMRPRDAMMSATLSTMP